MDGDQDAQPSIKIMPMPSIDFDLSDYLKPADKLRSNFGANFYWCLPMVAANTLGWTLYNPYEFTVSWRGGAGADAVVVECENSRWAASWFGSGTFTLFPPFIVRTSPGINLLVRPVPNYPRPTVLTLEGIVETDWLQASFTLNFMILMPLVRTTFKVGEPLVQLVPYPREYIERFDAQIVHDGESYEQEMADYKAWNERRTQQVAQPIDPDFDYMRGVKLDGQRVAEHKKLFRVPAFKQVKSDAEDES